MLENRTRLVLAALGVQQHKAVYWHEALVQPVLVQRVQERGEDSKTQNIKYLRKQSAAESSASRGSWEKVTQNGRNCIVARSIIGSDLDPIGPRFGL